MDDRNFDDLARRLATGVTRRAALKGVLAGFLSLVGTTGRAGAEVTQAQCGNKTCASNPGKCKTGCVCCVYPNGNSRCRPPGTCSPGIEGPGSPPTTTARPTTTTTVPPTTTAVPLPTSTTASPTTSTTTTLLPTTTSSTTSTTTSPPTNCRTDADCNDVVACTIDTCVDGVCQNTPNDALCPPTGSDCHRAVCGPDGCTTAINVGASCLYPDNRCVTRGVCDSEGFCLPLEMVDCTGFMDQCNDAFCHPATGFCQRTTVNTEGRPCDDGNPCTGTGTCSGGSCRFGPPIACPANRPICDAGSCVCQGNGLECPTPGSGVGCCDGQCARGVCCTPTGDFCQVDEQCCSGGCVRDGVNRRCG